MLESSCVCDLELKHMNSEVMLVILCAQEV